MEETGLGIGKQLDCGLFSYQILINLAVNFFKNELSPSKTLFWDKHGWVWCPNSLYYLFCG